MVHDKLFVTCRTFWSMCSDGSSFLMLGTMVVTRIRTVDSGDAKSKPRSFGSIVNTGEEIAESNKAVQIKEE